MLFLIGSAGDEVCQVKRQTKLYCGETVIKQNCIWLGQKLTILLQGGRTTRHLRKPEVYAGALNTVLRGEGIREIASRNFRKLLRGVISELGTTT